MSKLEKVALITGSTSGVGYGIANSFARAGYHIALNGFGEEELIHQIKSDISQKFEVEVEYFGFDVTNFEAFQKSSQEIVKKWGKIDVLVNNAGVQHVCAIEDFPIDRWQQVIDTNLTGVFYGIKCVLPFMKRHGEGRIINISSVHGIVASANKSAYVAAKHGVIGLTKVTALETASYPITCNAICPGWVLTPIVKSQIQNKMIKENLTFDEAAEELLLEKQPNGRFAGTEEIGEMAVYLASASARGITGSVFSIDGGWSAQ